jgi:hypothetical protein
MFQYVGLNAIKARVIYREGFPTSMMSSNGGMVISPSPIVAWLSAHVRSAGFNAVIFSASESSTIVGTIGTVQHDIYLNRNQSSVHSRSAYVGPDFGWSSTPNSPSL